MTSIEVHITETARDSLKDSPHTFNIVNESFSSIEDVKEFLADRYGHMPSGRNKVYVDTKDGAAQEIGFTYSFWTNDMSHNSKSWFQTDWVTIMDVVKTPRLL